MITFRKKIYELYFLDLQACPFALSPSDFYSVIGGNKEGILHELRYSKGNRLYTSTFWRHVVLSIIINVSKELIVLILSLRNIYCH